MPPNRPPIASHIHFSTCSPPALHPLSTRSPPPPPLALLLLSTTLHLLCDQPLIDLIASFILSKREGSHSIWHCWLLVETAGWSAAPCGGTTGITGTAIIEGWNWKPGHGDAAPIPASSRACVRRTAKPPKSSSAPSATGARLHDVAAMQTQRT